MRASRRAVCGGLWLALVISFGAAGSAAADYSSDPSGPTGWVPDGPVLAVATSGSRVFVGGGFTGGVAALDASTGALLWTGSANGDVRALALSSDGTHLLAGGLFSRVGGARHANLASLRVGDGTPEPGWTANAAGRVRDIVVRGDTAYFGGTFAQHNGLDQRGLGAVRVSTGEPVTDFDAATDGNVYSLGTDGSRLFVGGNYTQVDGQPRDSLASVNLTSNTLDPWQPTRPCTGCNVQWDIVVNGSTVYVCGRNAGAVTAFDATTAARRWRVPANGDGQALTLAGGKLYAGGHFVEIGNDELRVPRTQLAALDPATGAIDPVFRPRFVDSYPGIWALAATSTRLYAGGYFSAAGASPPKQHPYFAMFAATTANTAPTAQATADPGQGLTGQEITFSATGSTDAETPTGLSYSWDFGDGGSTADATGAVVHHAYPEPGRYTATVTVTDAGGATDTDTVAVDVESPNTAPTARATADPAQGVVDQEITFSGTGSTDAETPSNLVYSWDLGDGSSDATGAVVHHAYPQPGRYTATLTVTDPRGATDTDRVAVDVESAPVVDTTPPHARILLDPDPAYTRADITLRGGTSSDETTASGDLTYAWRFDSGTRPHTSTASRVTARFDEPGVHTVRLTVTDEAGNTDTATRRVQVYDVLHCQGAQVDLGRGWRVRENDGAVAGHYCSGEVSRGGRVSFTFRGPQVAVVHGDAQRGGTARVVVDGERQPALSFHGTQDRIEFLQQQSYAGLGTGRHTIRVVMTRGRGFLEGFVLP